MMGKIREMAMFTKVSRAEALELANSVVGEAALVACHITLTNGAPAQLPVCWLVVTKSTIEELADFLEGT